jgi:hypothetical protein
MYREVSFGNFVDAFRDMGRGDNFTYAGKLALFEYLEQYEEDSDTRIQLDVVALCSEYTEYSNLEEISYTYTDIQDLENEKEMMEWLQDHTQVIEFDGGIIIQDF